LEYQGGKAWRLSPFFLSVFSNFIAGYFFCVPTVLNGRFLPPGNIHDPAAFPDIAGSFGFAGQEACGLGGSFQSGVNCDKLCIHRQLRLSAHLFSPRTITPIL
jgi:hypothetical protein